MQEPRHRDTILPSVIILLCIGNLQCRTSGVSVGLVADQLLDPHMYPVYLTVYCLSSQFYFFWQSSFRCCIKVYCYLLVLAVPRWSLPGQGSLWVLYYPWDYLAVYIILVIATIYNSLAVLVMGAVYLVVYVNSASGHCTASQYSAIPKHRVLLTRTNQKIHHNFSVFECMEIDQNYAEVSLPSPHSI